MRGAVPPGALELQHELACAIALETLVGNRRAGDVAAQAFELLALMGVTAYCRMQAEALHLIRFHGVVAPHAKLRARSFPACPSVSQRPAITMPRAHPRQCQRA